MFKFSPKEDSPEYLGFMLMNENYSVNIDFVQEIITVPPITRIPNAPKHIEGAINLRGKVLKVVNLRKKLGLPFQHFDANTRIVILNDEGNSTGILVDRVLEVFKVEKGEQVDVPKMIRNEDKTKYANKILEKNDSLFINCVFGAFLEK